MGIGTGRGWKHFFVLIFWLLFHQGKSDWPPPGQEGDDVSQLQSKFKLNDVYQFTNALFLPQNLS
jgi:hypothetical protein